MVLTYKKKKIHFLGHLQFTCVICGEKIVDPKCKQMTCEDKFCDKEYANFKNWERKNYKLKSSSKSGRRNGI
jgi:hypothetical protein